MAKATAALLTEKLRHACGAASSVSFPIPVSRVWLKPLLARKIQQSECRPHHYGNALLVLGSETIDMDPTRPKAIWGFNGLNVPALFTWQRLWQLTARKDPGILHLRS